MDYDFSGWATRNDIRCTDGRTIRQNAFADQDGIEVPLVWNHQHNDPDNVLGHAVLENRPNGVYAYCKLNDTPSGKQAKSLVQNKDVTSLSIWANGLKQKGGDVLHGVIREVSLVLAGANPGAYIDSVMAHGEYSDEEVIIYSGENLELYHASTEDKKEYKKEEKVPQQQQQSQNTSGSGKTVKEVLETLNDEQSNAVYALIGALYKQAKSGNLPDLDDEESQQSQNANSKEEDEEMKHNVFEANTYDTDDNLIHDGLQEIINDAKRQGSMKESFLAHADEYGITNIDYLFPDNKNLDTPPQFIQREMDWVKTVINGTHHTPFSRIKSTFADITADEARAKGYLKGNRKKDEVFTLLKRTTSPTTIYKKQKMDRDDVIDITDFDVIAWLKSEMRMMLDEEIARAILIGDGRLASSDDKIKEDCIRPIVSDDDLYTIKSKVEVATNATPADKAKAFIDQVIRSRKDYKGSGTPTLFTTEDVVTECLLLEDGIGHKLYKSEQELATAMRVSNIVTVEVMEGLKNKDNEEVLGIVVNLLDYNVGADKGGAINMFDDFDIDYNQQKYLIETRCSGALIKPYSAIALSLKVKSA